MCDKIEEADNSGAGVSVGLILSKESFIYFYFSGNKSRKYIGCNKLDNKEKLARHNI